MGEKVIILEYKKMDKIEIVVWKIFYTVLALHCYLFVISFIQSTAYFLFITLEFF